MAQRDPKNQTTKKRKKRAVTMAKASTPMTYQQSNDSPSMVIKKKRRQTQGEIKMKQFKEPEKYFELNLKIREQQFEIEQLKQELTKGTQNTMENNTEITSLRQQLKLAINDYKMVHAYYKKQMDLFKNMQSQLMDEQKSNKKEVTKYIFPDDVKQIKLRNNGVRMYFGDGEDVVFDNVEVLKGKDYNDDDQYKNMIQNVVEEEVKNEDTQITETLGEDDIIILCLNELTARIGDFRQYDNAEQHARIIQERYDALSIYNFDNDYLNKLKINNNSWINLFRNNSVVKKEFIEAQTEIKSGKQPTICVKNNVTLNNMNNHKKKPKNVKFSKFLQSKIDKFIHKGRMSTDSKNYEEDEDLNAFKEVNVSNGWFIAQNEMKK